MRVFQRLQRLREIEASRDAKRRQRDLGDRRLDSCSLSHAAHETRTLHPSGMERSPLAGTRRPGSLLLVLVFQRDVVVVIVVLVLVLVLVDVFFVVVLEVVVVVEVEIEVEVTVVVFGGHDRGDGRKILGAEGNLGSQESTTSVEKQHGDPRGLRRWTRAE
jgi:hypothetical protein